MPPPPEEAAQEGTKNSGRCHRAHSTPRITDARSGPCKRSMRGKREAAPAYFLKQWSSQDRHESEGSQITKQVGRTS